LTEFIGRQNVNIDEIFFDNTRGSSVYSQIVGSVFSGTANFVIAIEKTELIVSWLSLAKGGM
jgi:hypothetical protein